MRYTYMLSSQCNVKVNVVAAFQNNQSIPSCSIMLPIDAKPEKANTRHEPLVTYAQTKIYQKHGITMNYVYRKRFRCE